MMVEKVNNGQIRPISQPPVRKPASKEAPATSFREVLERETGRLQFSKHAQQRIYARSINVSEGDLERLEEATRLAASKGASDSLIMVGNVAYVVSVKNNTVITAVAGDNLKNNVFTNIDSAVILD